MQSPSGGVIPAGVKWVAPPDPFDRTPPAIERSILVNRIHRVRRTVRCKPARVGRQKGGDEYLICPDNDDENRLHDVSRATRRISRPHSCTIAGWMSGRPRRRTSHAVRTCTTSVASADAAESAAHTAGDSTLRASRTSRRNRLRATAPCSRADTTIPTRKTGGPEGPIRT